MRLFVCALLLCMAQSANAALVTSLVGDKDGFGLPGAPAVPADGTLWETTLGGVFFTDYRDAGDVVNAPFTDQWFADADLSYVHAYSLGASTPVSAVLEVQTAGIADNRGPWDVLFNGTFVGQFTEDNGGSAFEQTKIWNFIIPIGLLTGSDNVLLKINNPSVTDGYSINYSELSIVTTPAGVPEPSTCLMGIGLIGCAAAARARKRKAALATPR